MNITDFFSVHSGVVLFTAALPRTTLVVGSNLPLAARSDGTLGLKVDQFSAAGRWFSRGSLISSTHEPTAVVRVKVPFCSKFIWDAYSWLIVGHLLSHPTCIPGISGAP